MPRETDKMLNEFLINVAGGQTMKIVNAINEPKSDEQLAENCKIKISDVRSVLNKLHYYGIVNYERKRDNETGWYSYVWKLNRDKMTELVDKEERKKLEILSLEKTSQIFKCSNCETTVPFEAAYDMLFRCSGCGSGLNYIESYETTVVEKAGKGPSKTISAKEKIKGKKKRR